jgi:hypothetical protein
MFTRDSILWNVLFSLGGLLTVALAPVTDPASYGLTIVQLNWLKLIGGALLAAGKLGNSPLQSKQEARAEDRLEARQDAQDAGRR